METITVDLSHYQYPIYIGQKLLSDATLLKKHLIGKQVLIVSNKTVADLYLKPLIQALTGCDVATLLLNDGEQYKNFDSLNEIFSALLQKKFDRSVTLLALGGGVIGDMTGFAAACYRRGVAFIQIPTTLLAQVDAAIGGKTAINHPLGKNMIGAFYQPRAVISDVSTLKTLSDREYRAGLAEVIKYGLIADQSFFAWLETHLNEILARTDDSLEYMISRCSAIKAQIVSQDEKEQNLRAILNLGHTFGHAIEAATHYQTFLHGEAVAIGMLMAGQLSVLQGLLTKIQFQRIQALINACQFATALPKSITLANFLEFISQDKKVIDKALRLVLLDDIGHAIITDQYQVAELHQVIQTYLSST